MKIDSFISGLKNAQNCNLGRFSVKKSNILREITGVMVKNGYLSGFSEDTNNLNINLKYPLINRIDIKMVSKPSKRVYMDVKSLRENKDLLIVSTTNGGIFTNRDIAVVNGGEVLIKISN